MHGWSAKAGSLTSQRDQFAADPVIVTPVTDMRYGKGNIDTAPPEYVLARTRAVSAVLPSWVEFRAAKDSTRTTREI